VTVFSRKVKYIIKSVNYFIILLLLITVICSGYCVAQDKISISSSVDKRNIKIGDIITYKVEVVHNKDIEVSLPGLGANLGGFEIRDYEEFDPRKEDGNIVSGAEYLISTFTTGKFVIPPLEVQYKEPGDTVYKKLATRKIEINVESMKPSEEGDIRDIKEPVELPYFWWEAWGKWAALGLGVLIVATGSYIIYRRKKQNKAIIPKKVPPPRPPHEIALESLDRVKQEKLWEKGEIKKYYTEISEIIRAYCEGRFYIPALERTSSEILDELHNISIEPEVYALIQELLSVSDMVKFAKVIPESETHKKIMQSAYTIVEKTKVLPIEDTKEKDETSDHSCTETEKTEETVTDLNNEEVREVNPSNAKNSSEGEK